MTRSRTLDTIAIASPCSANWEEMQGDDKVRFCGDCQRNVFNLSGVSRAEAEELVKNREGRLCVRFYQRPDGTLLTRDCPVGLAALRAKLLRRVAQTTAMLGCLFAGFGRLHP